MRSLLYSAVATLRIGMDILTEQEKVTVNQLLGHGGLFKTERVGQSFMASALNIPVSVMETAGEGGPWGMALLAAYMLEKRENESLEDFLAGKVFANAAIRQALPQPEDAEGFKTYMKRYMQGLSIEKAAVEYLPADSKMNQ